MPNSNIKLNLSVNTKSLSHLLASLLICLLSSYAICLYVNSNIFFHTDSFAPIQEIISLINFDDVGIGDLHLARIPSLVPDLTIVYLLVKLFGQNNFFLIQSAYALISIFLFFIITTSILHIINKSLFNLTISSLIVVIPNLILIKFSSIFREVLGYFLTPLHQGGNIIVTTFFILLLLVDKELVQSEKNNYFSYSRRFLYLFMTIVAALAIISNKLFIFTIILPLIVIKSLDKIIEITKYKQSRYFMVKLFIYFLVSLFMFFLFSNLIGINIYSTFTLSLFIFKVLTFIAFLFLIFLLIYYLLPVDKSLYNDIIFNVKNLPHILNIVSFDIFGLIRYNFQIRFFIFFLLPTFIGLSSIFINLNTQCMYPFNINISNTLSESKIVLLKWRLISPIITVYTCLIIFSIYKKINNHLHSDIYFLNLFIGLSGLSPLLYLLLTEGIYSRYILITVLLFPLTLSILFSFTFRKIYHLPNKKTIDFLFCFLISIFLSFLFLNTTLNSIKSPNYSFTRWPINKTILLMNPSNLYNKFYLPAAFKRSAFLSKSDFALDHEQINNLGLHYGLSDYWGSSVAQIGMSDMKVLPVLANGKPNFWAHSRSSFMDFKTNSLINFNFVYSRSLDFTNSIIHEYGMPTNIYRLDKEDIKPINVRLDSVTNEFRYILYYEKNSPGFLKIRDRISQKLLKEGCQ
tara:strand:+ start:2084 stop:4147 length:2064 start_codon:yes stop_codon:yes gene_type:complete